MKTVHLVFNAHLDPIWLWPWEAGLDEVATQKLIGSQGTEVIEAEFEEIPNVEDL